MHTIEELLELYRVFAQAVLDGKTPKLFSIEHLIELRSLLSEHAFKRLMDYGSLREIQQNKAIDQKERNALREAAIRTILGYDPLEGLQKPDRVEMRVPLFCILVALQYLSEKEGLAYLNDAFGARASKYYYLYVYNGAGNEDKRKLFDAYPRLTEDDAIRSVSPEQFLAALNAIGKML